MTNMPPPVDPTLVAHRDCPACQALDAADGVQDGRMFSPTNVHAKNVNILVGLLSRAQDRAADKVTNFAGSLKFVYIHSVWFGIWILLNLGVLGAALKFDPYPYGLLTMIVSLEAIFLSTFVMVSQNRQAQRAELRSDMDFENNLRAEIWAVHIGAKLGIDPAHVEDVVQDALRQIASESSPTTSAPES